MSHVVLTSSFNKGPYVFVVSDLKRDYPGVWSSDSQLTGFVKNYMYHAVKFLNNLGYSPVTIKLVSGYSDELVGRFDWQPGTQASMRIKIMASYLQSLQTQRPKTRDLSYLSSALDSAKTE